MHFTRTRTLLAFFDEFDQAVPLSPSLKETKQFAKEEGQPFLLMVSRKLRKCSQKRVMLRDLTSLVD